MIRLNAISSGSRAFASGSGLLLNHSSRAITLDFKSRVITLLNREGVLAPSSIIVDADSLDRMEGVATMSEGRLTSNRFSVIIENVVDLRLSARRGEARGTSFAERVLRSCLHPRERSIMNALLSVLGDEIPSPESRLETVVLKDQIRCLKGEEGRCDAMSLAQKLLGKGFGLTPSGDDFILGVVSIMDLFGSDVSVLRKIIDPYQNAFSRTMLLDALDGYYPQPLLSLLNCLSPSSSSSPAGEKYAQSSAASLLRLGHASGHDIISGMYWAVSRLV